MMMSKFLVEQLVFGTRLDNCTLARAPKANSIIFAKTVGGKIFSVNRRRAIDLVDEYGSNPADRSCYAKLAGVRVKDINAARKEAREKDKKDSDKREEFRLRSTAAKLGFKLVRTIKP